MLSELGAVRDPDTDKLAIPGWHLPDLLHTGMPTSGSNNAPLRETALSLAAGVYFRGLVGEPLRVLSHASLVRGSSQAASGL